MKEDFERNVSELRSDIVLAAANAGGGHIGGAFSVLEILYYSYSEFINFDSLNPQMEDRDRLILSKGHGCLALYAVLERFSMLEKGELQKFLMTDSRLAGHSEHFHIPHIEITTGSLGHGIGVAAGMALAGKRARKDWKVICILGDGECNEGSVWESLLFASQHELDNLIVVIDSNKLESLDFTENILGIAPLASKLEAFGLDVMEIDGHDYDELKNAFGRTPRNKPMGIVANTIKGKGVSFMEGITKWHYRAPSKLELEIALRELDPNA